MVAEVFQFLMLLKYDHLPDEKGFYYCFNLSPIIEIVFHLFPKVDRRMSYVNWEKAPIPQ
jgi:hypothetical protein